MDIDVAKKILGESTELDEASIEVDFMYPKAAWFKKLLKKYRLKMKVIDPGGGDGGTDVIKLDGKKKDIMGILKDPKGFDEYGYYSQDLAKNIEEGKFDKIIFKKKLKESTAEYAKSLEKIANDRKMKNLSKDDKATLMKIAAMMAKEDIEEEAERMPYDKVIKKLRDGEWDTSMDVKKRMHLTYTDNTERRKHLRGVQKVVFVEDVDTEEKPTTEK